MERTTSIEEHLRAASDAIMLLVSQVAELERHKRGVPPDDERFDELARAVRRAADELADFAKQEESWALGATDSAPPAAATIDETRPPRNLSEVLDRWRTVERRLQQTDPGTPESRRLFEEFEAARDEYMAAFQERVQRD